MSLVAKLTHPEYGYDLGKQEIAKLGLQVGDTFPVLSVSMGQSHTTLTLLLPSGEKFHTNSVHFDIFKDGQEHDIFSDPEYNPYISPLYTRDSIREEAMMVVSLSKEK